MQVKVFSAHGYDVADITAGRYLLFAGGTANWTSLAVVDVYVFSSCIDSSLIIFN